MCSNCCCLLSIRQNIKRTKIYRYDLKTMTMFILQNKYNTLAYDIYYLEWCVHFDAVWKQKHGTEPTVFKIRIANPAFTLMSTGEKLEEYRSASVVKNRLYDHDGKLKHYDVFEGFNGQKHPIERFRAKWIGFRLLSDEEKQKPIKFSDGTIIDLSIYDYAIIFERPMSRIVKY